MYQNSYSEKDPIITNQKIRFPNFNKIKIIFTLHMNRINMNSQIRILKLINIMANILKIIKLMNIMSITLRIIKIL